MDASFLIGILIAGFIAYLVYSDAITRGWRPDSAVIMAVAVFTFLIIFLPIYLIIRNNPGRSKVVLAANRSIVRQLKQELKSIGLNSSEISKEVGIRQVAIVRQMLFQARAKGEIPRQVEIY
jgi:MFS family permease